MQAHIIGLLFFFVSVSFALTADAQNPFDLQHRLQQDVVEELNQLKDTSGVQEIIPREDGVGEDEAIIQKEDTYPINESELPREIFEGEKLSGEHEQPVEEIHERPDVETEVFKPPSISVDPSEKSDNNFLLFIFLLVSIIIALVVAVDRSIMDRIYRSLINHNFLNYFLREQKGSTSLQLLFLFIVFLVNMGLFVLFLAREALNWPVDIKLWQTTGLVTLIYLGRYIFTGYLSLFVGARKELRQFYFTIYIFNIFLGLVLFPLNAFIAFAPDILASSAMYLALAMVIMLYFLRQLRGLFIGSKYLITNQFHFFIYLCTVEIAPLVLLGKFFISISI
ncbi:MAG: DUF4271 domain-containing protein [Saprospirales bacterium]|nr:MAG: DUF4271 domain-containing protein [Saprospirales bacterium]